MLELFILWRLGTLNDSVDGDDGPEDTFFWLLVGSLLFTWPVLLYNIMRRRGDSRYMSASVAVGVAAISLAFGLGYYLGMSVFAFAFVAYLLIRAEYEDEYED